MPRKPHIVIFNPDQWRGDVLGHMGNPAAVTPNLDRAAREDSVSFRHAFCQNPVCTPSRCSFMTGWYPHTRGHRTMVYMLRPDEPMLLRTLKEEGWFVWWGGKNDLVPAQHGYENYCDVKYDPPNTAERPSYPTPMRRTAGAAKRAATPTTPFSREDRRRTRPSTTSTTRTGPTSRVPSS